ncbi:putative lipoprotein DUF2279 [Flavobacterium croceum DSM 17960]|uniref:Putative lipoprotein DUF2279 n=1 Tax=Flavobacterium croceum DSM 17960 TaxID=1121886 RepID=A0A2S4N596_9FLAO|nr:DUF2279 domain-containing protein [Flavobacterium croceum]POS00846.1 putative lipoprotein DUF2279 [Flavobacterium croceum DSM 17960]
MLQKTIIFLFSIVSWAQNDTLSFLKPADTLHLPRKNAVILSQTTVATSALVGLNRLWYKDYPQSNFHFVNDYQEWLQMDKLGHFYSCYHLAKINSDALGWAGVSRKNRLLYGASSGLLFMTIVEVFDGYSAQWGFSSTDMVANTLGTGLYVSQELMWKEQRITPKFSFHTTSLASARPTALGSSFAQQLLKDYNGQTYWLSFNVYAFTKNKTFPKWFNLAIGYGGENMFYAHKTEIGDTRYRQLYVSFDVDLTKIRTKSHTLKTIFSVLNTIKFPTPTVEFSSLNGCKMHFIYF